MSEENRYVFRLFPNDSRMHVHILTETPAFGSDIYEVDTFLVYVVFNRHVVVIV